MAELSVLLLAGSLNDDSRLLDLSLFLLWERLLDWNWFRWGIEWILSQMVCIDAKAIKVKTEREVQSIRRLNCI